MLAKTDVRTLAQDVEYVRGWLERQPQDKVYNYCIPDVCLFGDFLSQHGAVPNKYYVSEGTAQPPGIWLDFAVPKTGASTYGDALQRLNMSHPK